MIRAVIFDIGGPLDLETAHEAAVDADIRAGLEREGFSVSQEAFAAANQRAIETFAPNLYRSIIWQLTKGDEATSQRVADYMEERAAGRSIFELRPGIEDVLKSLRARGLKLGLAANQPGRVLATLEEHGIAEYFSSQAVTGVYGYRKPDVRLFLRVCDDLGVMPSECVMVGDRIDNDIAPAKLLGMQTVLLRSGRHASQQPRSWDERPDCEVMDAAGILQAVILLTEQAIDPTC